MTSSTERTKRFSFGDINYKNMTLIVGNDGQSHVFLKKFLFSQVRKREKNGENERKRELSFF